MKKAVIAAVAVILVLLAGSGLVVFWAGVFGLNGHRLLAGTAVMLIAVLVTIAWAKRSHGSKKPG